MRRNQLLSIFKNATAIDWWYIGSIFILLLFGLLMQYSIAMNKDITDPEQFTKQALFVIAGIGLFAVFSIIDHRRLQARSLWWYAACVMPLLAVLLFGQTIQGTKGWFVIAGFSLQPVEFVKVLFIIFMAHFFEQGLMRMREWRIAFLSGSAAALLVALVLLQPDLGSAIILFALWFAYALFLRAPAWFLALVVAVVVSASIAGWFFFFEDYQKDRLIVFLDPQKYEEKEGYNVIQSMIAVGSGSFWGRGLGFGTQSQLHFLPEVSSDFVFAALAEEFGFVGVSLILLAIGILLFRLWVYMKYTNDTYFFLLCFGTFFYILIQSTMIIGMNLGVLPVTGVPLPLVSAGGSSMLATMALLGLIHFFSVHGKIKRSIG
jgi:rod shape determining protein RodA